MTVREVLDAAREAALEIRRIEEQTEVRRQAIGVQGHSYGVHSKSGILDPSRKIDELMQWEQDLLDMPDLQEPIDEAYRVVAGASRCTSDLGIELVTRYYLQAESYVTIARDLADVRGLDFVRELERKAQIEAIVTRIDDVIARWEMLGIARLKELA